MSKWDEWKKAQGETRPWHLLDGKKYLQDQKIADQRLDICKECPFFINGTSQCSKCGCIMPLKVKLEAAACPEGKW
jgi:hypothetical protein